MKTKKHRLYRKSLASLVLAALALTFVTPAAQAASGPLASVSLTQVTGTAPFDTDDTAGNDASGTNSVVRTNDNVTYRTEITVGSQKATGTHLYITLPKGEQALQLPPYCLDGSTVTPQLSDPGPSLTATSWTSLKAQTIDCFLGDLPAASSQIFPITSRVRPEVPHNTQLSAVTARVTGGTGTLTTGAVSHRVSAKAAYDVSIGHSDKKNGATIWGPSQTECPNDVKNGCYWTHDLPVMISVPEGGKGTSPLLSGFTYTLDLSAKGVYGDRITETAAWKAAGAGAEAKFRPVIPAHYGNCVVPGQWQYGPYGDMSDPLSNETNSVRDSGTSTCKFDDATGKMTVTVTGADTTAWTSPTTNAEGKTALPTDRAYVYKQALGIHVPFSTVKALGIPSSPSGEGTPSVWTLGQTVTVSEVSGKALNGSAVTPSEKHTVDWNNYRTSSLVAKDSGSFDTFWTGIPGTPGNTPRGQFESSRGWDGLPGQGSPHGGDGILLAGQAGLANQTVIIDGNMPNLGVMSCLSWDNTALSVTTDNWITPGGHNQSQPSNGKALWLSGGYFLGTKDAAVLDVQYGSGPAGSADNSTCDNADSKHGWNSNPAAVKDFKTGKVTPAADAAAGNFTAVNRVRTLIRAPSTDRTAAVLSMGLRYIGGKKTGDTLPYWGTSKAAGYYTSLAEFVADTDNPWSKTSYNPGATSDDPQSGSRGARALAGTATSRVDLKFAGSDGQYDSGTPAYVAGSKVKMRIAPNITAPIETTKSYPMSVELCLPAGVSLVAGSSTVAPGQDVLVPANTTKGTSVKCQPQERYLTFDLGRRVPNSTVPPIELTVKVATTAPNSVLTATAAVQVTGDPSPAASRTDTADVQIESPVGIRLGRTAASTIIEVNPAATMAKPRLMSWNTEFVNLNSPSSISDVEVYEVLPRAGYGNTKFSGTLAFQSATVAQGTGVVIQYTNSTKLAINDANGTVSDGTTAGPVWHATVAAAGGASKVTGLKITRAGAFKPADNLNVKVSMLPLNNQPGDIYEGRVSGKAVGLKSFVGPEISAVEVVGSSIGDYMWIDNNKDGLQTAGEIGLAGKTVTLTGTDNDGNAVPEMTTTTDTKGKYIFNRLASGNYTVDFDSTALAAEDYTLAAPSGIEGEADSAPNKTTGKAAVVLKRAAKLLDVDAGVQTETKLTASLAANPASGTYVSEKDPVSYTLTITNNGTKDFSNAVVDVAVADGIKIGAVTASQAAGTVTLSGNKVTYTGPVAKGITRTVTFKGVTGTGVEDTKITAKVSGTGTWAGGQQPSTCDVATPAAGCSVVHTWSQPKLGVSSAVVQSDTADELATVGEKLTYSFKVTNTGNVPVRGIQARIEMPAGNTLATGAAETAVYNSPAGTGADLAAKAVQDFGAVTHVYTVDQDDVDWGQILSRVTAAGATKAGAQAATGSANVTVKTPSASQLRLTAAVQDDSGDGTAQVGEELTYRFKVVNSGAVSVENLDISDAFLDNAGISISPEHTYDGRLSPGEAVVYISRGYTVTPEDKVAKAVSTDSSAKGATRKRVPVESNSHRLVASTPSADGLDIVKRVSDAGGDGFADSGEALTYTFTVTNNSAVEAADGSASGYDFHGVEISDPMLSGVEITPAASDAGFDGRLTPGQTASFISGKYTVTAADTTAGAVTNKATASAVNSLNKAVTSNTATASIPTTPTKVIIKTGSGAGPHAGTAQGTAGALLLLGALVVALQGRRRRCGL